MEPVLSEWDAGRPISLVAPALLCTPSARIVDEAREHGTISGERRSPTCGLSAVCQSTSYRIIVLTIITAGRRR
jgi:hypothetical protein